MTSRRIAGNWSLLLAGLAIALVAATPPNDQSSALERDPDGWIDLLEGKDLSDWTRVPIPPAPEGELNPDSQWSLDSDSGILFCSGDKGHEMLLFDRDWDDVIYHVEWRFVPTEGQKGYNSGVYVRNSADGAIWHQAQTGDGSGGFLFGNTLVNGERERVNLSKSLIEQRVKPAGEWNTFEITCRGQLVSLWVNGAETCRWDACEIPSGRVGLEAEGWPIQFRNVKIKPLSTD